MATWEEQIVQFPVDGDRHYLKYRTDVIDDPELQRSYQEATGNELRVPQTWKEYAEIASFFNGTEVSGRTVYGSAEVTKRDDLMFSAFISRAAPYAKHPEVGGGFFFELETMTPLINTPGFVEALSDMVAAEQYWPPGGNNFGLSDEIFSFGGGETVFSYSWDDAYVQALQADSPIREAVAAAPLPGSERVWNRKTDSWDEFAEVNYAPYITWGWTSAVTACSANKDAAFDYLGFFSNPENTASDLTIGRFGVNPYRTSHFDVNFWTSEAGWPEQAATSYIDTLETYEASTNRVFDLRIPGVNEYMTSLAAGVAQAIAGQLEPQAALDAVAQEWADITERYGVEEQQRAYANIVQLEDNLRELPLFGE